MGDTSLVFNLIAKDQASGELSEMGQKWATAGATIGAGLAAALGVGVVQNLDMGAASDKLAAQLGVGPAEAAELSKVSANVYKNAWGDSIETVNEAVKGVYQNIGNTAEAKGGIEGLTTKALALAETFGQEVGPTTAAVGQMIKTGLAKNADEAFDILTVGFQKGANKADDLLDTFGEYGTQFRKFGLDGKMATGLLTQGLKAGARDADIVADAVKEFSIRAIDGSESTADGFKAIGLSAGDMAAKIGKGGKSATGALDLTLDRLRAIDDPVKREAAAVALFGTQAEDLGQALFALDPSSAVKALGDVGGAADKMAKTVGDNPAAALESFKRKVMLGLGEVAGKFVQFGMANQGAMKPLAAVLGTVAGVVMTVAIAQKLYATYTAIATAATTVHQSTLYRTIAGYLRLMAVGLMAYVRIAAAAVASAATTAAAWLGSALAAIGTWIASVVRAGLVAARQFLMMAARAVVWAATMAAQWLIAMGPVGWVIAAIVGLVALVIANWGKIKRFTAAAWNWIWGKIKAVGVGIRNAVLLAAVAIYNTWVRINNRVRGAVSSAWNWIRSKISGVMSSARNVVRNAIAGIGNAFISIHIKAQRALSGAGRWLWNAGRNIIRGLINGILSMIGAIGNAMNRAMSKARSFLPFSPAKQGPFSGRGWTLYSGQSMMTGLAEGIHRRREVVTAAVQAVAQGASEAMPTGRVGTAARPMTAAPILAGSPVGGTSRLIVDFRNAPEHLKGWLRKAVRTDGRGDVDVFFRTR